MSDSSWMSWVTEHPDTMGVSIVCAFLAAGITTLLQKFRGSSIAVALLSAFLFTIICVPSAATEFGWQFPRLLLLSLFIGFGGISISLGFIVAADKLRSKVGIIVDRYVDSKIPDVQNQPPPAVIPPPGKVP